MAKYRVSRSSSDVSSPALLIRRQLLEHVHAPELWVLDLEVGSENMKAILA